MGALKHGICKILMSRAKLGLSMGRNLTSGSPLAIIIWDDGSYKTWSTASSSLPLPLFPFHLPSSPFSNNSVQPTTTTCTSRLLRGRTPARQQQQLQVGDSRDTSVPRRKPPNAPGVSNHSDLVAPSASPDLFHLASSKSRLSASLPLASFGNQREPKAPTASRSREFPPARQREDQRRPFTTLGTCSQKTLVPPCLATT